MRVSPLDTRLSHTVGQGVSVHIDSLLSVVIRQRQVQRAVRRREATGFGLAEYLGHHDPAFTLRISHMLPSSHARASQAVQKRLMGLVPPLAEQSRSSADTEVA